MSENLNISNTVRTEQLAWECGVLVAKGYFPGTPKGRIPAKLFGVPRNLAKFFRAGMSEAAGLEENKVRRIAEGWSLLPELLVQPEPAGGQQDD